MWDNTPLLAACMYGHSEVALKLIERGADAGLSLWKKKDKQTHPTDLDLPLLYTLRSAQPPFFIDENC